MLLTSQGDVEARLGRSLTVEEDARFDAVCADISAYLYVVAPRIPTAAPIPAAVVGVASALVIDALATPAGSGAVLQESLGGYSVTYRSGGDAEGFGLTAGMLGLLAPWRRARISSVGIDASTATAVGQ